MVGMLSTLPLKISDYPLDEEPRDPGGRDSLTPEDIARFFRRSWRLCIVWIIGGLCLGAALLFVLPAHYTAYTVLLFDDGSSRLPADQAVRQAQPDPAYADSQIQVVQSDEVLGRVVDKYQPTKTGESENGRGIMGLLSGLLGLGDGPVTRHEKIVLIKKELSVHRIGLSNAVEIGFTAGSPTRAAETASAVARAYVEDQTDLWRKAREEAAYRLLKKLAELHDRAFGVNELAKELQPATPEDAEKAQRQFREQQNAAETSRALYNNLLQRSYIEAFEQPPSARVISPAEPPEKPTWPRPFLVFAATFLLGAVGGIGHAIFRRAADHSLWAAEDVRRLTNVDRVIDIPTLRRRNWKKSIPGNGGLQSAYLKRSAIFSEALTRLEIGFLARQNQRRSPVVGVVAPTRQAGASSVAAHLAKVIAETGLKVVLVDANWRKSADAGKSKSKSDESPARSLAASRSTVENFAITVLRPAAAISDLNASLSVATSLKQLLSDYDRVIVDFHSVEETADLEACLAVVGEMILVVEAKRTPLEGLRGLLRSIPSDRMTAVIVNKV